MMQLTVAAPAKLNLYLHSMGKRADGYHLLDTAFQLIDLQDTVRLQTRDDGRIVLHTPIAGLDDTQHLAVRAAHCLKTATSGTLGADIWVEKRIPSGAGLGGGSSDAASTLMGLNQLWRCGLTRTQLQALGLTLGADVPFFCSGKGAVRAQGIGELFSALPASQGVFTVIYPGCHVPTPAVFRHPDLTWRNKQAIIYALTQNDSELFASSDFGNDLQAVAVKIAPAVAQALDTLKAVGGALMVRMSGSGSAVFAQYPSIQSQQIAWAALQENAPKHWQMWALSGLEKHPFVV